MNVRQLGGTHMKSTIADGLHDGLDAEFGGDECASGRQPEVPEVNWGRS